MKHRGDGDPERSPATDRRGRPDRRDRPGASPPHAAPLLSGTFASPPEAPELPEPPAGLDRRSFLGISLGALPAVHLAGVGLRSADPAAPAEHLPPPPPPAEAAPAALAEAAAPDAGRLVVVSLQLNGQPRELRVDPRASLLDALREDLSLDGTKKGCDHGQCGACTVLLDGRRVLSCLTLAAAASEHRVTTIEGLGEGDRLHPVQAAFLAHDAFQCGYCTPGQILSAVGLLAEGCPNDAAAIREHMSGNICRCGAYPNIVAAIQQAHPARTA
jgi:xanthine dehydrogenase YagT iron-sulfur-binding subunit